MSVSNTRSEGAIPNDPKTQPQWVQGRLQMYILPLNGVLALLVSFNALTFYGKPGVHEAFWILCVIPAGESWTYFKFLRLVKLNSRTVLLLVVLALKRIISDDVDIAGLESLRYEYKGA